MRRKGGKGSVRSVHRPSMLSMEAAQGSSVWELALAKELSGFAGLGESAGTNFLEEHLAILADFEDAATSTDELDILVGHALNFSRHTVGFRTVISLLAILDLDHVPSR